MDGPGAPGRTADQASGVRKERTETVVDLKPGAGISSTVAISLQPILAFGGN
ncbi:hypothetical protein JANAI62_37530 [Jannaschia pagri]|uniref:Uncharacterized protein n=1 Tax=Jannaschia pagri TaxID=2829797 RepID=A0ABQ4NRT1_9RHOB|nr:hypothetical protein JANAI61_37980 [Jannaschia sp. AI_61]GIT97130.1 hypothetical protein JANAI62_37530 [Jannaschia sp. AI_62]